MVEHRLPLALRYEQLATVLHEEVYDRQLCQHLACHDTECFRELAVDVVLGDTVRQAEALHRGVVGEAECFR